MPRRADYSNRAAGLAVEDLNTTHIDGPMVYVRHFHSILTRGCRARG